MERRTRNRLKIIEGYEGVFTGKLPERSENKEKSKGKWKRTQRGKFGTKRPYKSPLHFH